MPGNNVVQGKEHSMDYKTVQIGSAQYAYYEIANPGKPKMVMLHGMMVDAHCFEKIAEQLQNDYHLFLFDLKGHGKSSDGESFDANYANEVICSDLLAIYQQVIGEPFFLVGYSLGGQYTLRFAGTHPEAVRAAIVIDSAPTVSFKGILAILWAMFKTPKVFKNKEHVIRFYDARIPGLGDYMFKHCMTDLGNGRYAIRYDRKRLAPPTAAKAAARTKDIWEACKKIVAPTLVLRAEKSFVLNDKIAAQLQASNPKIEIALMQGMEHNLVFTHPQAVADKIRQFAGRAG